MEGIRKCLLTSPQRCMGMAIVSLTVVFFLSTGISLAIASYAEDPIWQSWGKRVAEQLARFIPNPGPNYIDRMPWEEVSESPAFSGGAGGSYFYTVSVYRRWAFADAALIKEGQALVEQRKLVQQRGEALLNEGKMDEYMKLAREEGPKLDALEHKLKEQARYLQFDIEGNYSLQERFGTFGFDFTGKPIGSVGGYTLYRFSDTNDYGFKQVKLVVYIGRVEFKNPLDPQRKPQPELKSILLTVRVRSDKEAVAREMIEKVDYSGLAKLLGR